MLWELKWSVSIVSNPVDFLLCLRFPTRKLQWSIKITDRAKRCNPVKSSIGNQVVNLPDPPLSVSISNNKILSGSPIGTVVGKLITSDYDPNDTFTYSLVSGQGGEDNSSFIILGDTLNTTVAVNYNTKTSYSIRVLSTDSSGLSVTSRLIIYVVIPIAKSFSISGLIGSPTRITLQGEAVLGSSLTYQIISNPKYGTLTQESNGVYNYVPSTNQPDSFKYTVSERNINSLPGTVTIQNYSQEDIRSMPKQQGTWTFNNISFDGNQWTFGNFTSSSFLQYERLNILGETFTFYK